MTVIVVWHHTISFGETHHVPHCHTIIHCFYITTSPPVAAAPPPPPAIHNLALHALTLRSTGFTVRNLVVGLGRHATCYTAKHHVCHAIRNGSRRVNRVTVRQTSQDPAKARQKLQTIRTTNQTNVVLVQTQTIAFANHHATRRRRQTGTTKGFQAHAGHGASRITATTRLQAATSAKVAYQSSQVMKCGRR